MVIFILLFAAFLFNSEKMRKTQYKWIWFELEIFIFSVEPTDTHQNVILLLGYYFYYINLLFRKYTNATSNTVHK